MRRKRKEQTIEKNHMYHLYYLDGMFFVGFYGPIAYGYSTEAAAREAIYYHFN